MSAVALRPYLPADAPRCAAIFRASIEEIASEDYSEAQCAAWAERADDEAGFGKGLAGMLTLLATEDGEIAGFASLKDDSHVEMLFVDPAYARRGVATVLLEALTKLARARGAKELTSDVSDTAKPLFDRLGFQSFRRNLVNKGEEWLGNTSMRKSLEAPAAPSSTRH
jgi:putative acetyltransferase